MRRRGLIPFDAITDTTRQRIVPAMWDDLADYAETVAVAYKKNLWKARPHHIEFFVEKDAMAGVIQPVTYNQYRVSLIPTRGDLSETWCFAVAEEWNKIEKPIYVYYLGDHDPKGSSRV
jgi:hypothetical protein